ncbi:MAG: lysophospholipid acyltransferase family protein [Parvularculaceae bacterium]
MTMRSLAFRAAYWATSVFFALTATPLLLAPSRKPLTLWILLYTRVVTFWMRVLAGIRIEVRGRENLPAGPCVIAAKHQSWGDGVVMFAQFYDLAFVVGDHLEKFPLVGGILRKLGAIIVDNCGGAYARARRVDAQLVKARAENRSVLIYPEGHLSPAGRRHRYRRGVFHIYAAYGCAAAPVATNLGLFWPQASWSLKPGVAVVEFLPPIPPGLAKEAFMTDLERAIETRTNELVAEADPTALVRNDPLPDPAPKRAAQG